VPGLELTVGRRPRGVSPGEVLDATRTPAERLAWRPGRPALAFALPAMAASWLVLSAVPPTGWPFGLACTLIALSTGDAIGALLSFLTSRSVEVLFTSRFLLVLRDGRVDCIGWSEVTRIELVITRSGSPVALNFFHHRDCCGTLSIEHGDLAAVARRAAGYARARQIECSHGDGEDREETGDGPEDVPPPTPGPGEPIPIERGRRLRDGRGPGPPRRPLRPRGR
jgi:hypothetical protein